MTWAVRPGSGRCRWTRTASPRSTRTGSAIERLPPEQYLAASYYERWLGALEMLVAEKGALP